MSGGGGRREAERRLESEKLQLERRETRKVGQREEKRTREAGTKMQCSTW